ncbi:MAG: addiction module protein [Acidobacteriaceae bacterium]
MRREASRWARDFACGLTPAKRLKFDSFRVHQLEKQNHIASKSDVFAKHLTSGGRLPSLKAMASLPNNIRRLTPAEKFELIDALWEDLETHASTLSAEQAEELDRRISSCEKDPPVGTSWEQVKAGLPRR